MTSALFIQSRMAKTRAKYGGTVTLGGKTFAMTTRSLEPREREFLPEGLVNAADADLRVFCMTPSDFPLWPAIGSALTWESIAYTVIAVRPGDDVIGNVYMKLELFVYKTPPPNTATGEVAADLPVTTSPSDTPTAAPPKTTQDNIWRGRESQ